MPDLEALTEKAQEMGDAVEGIFAILAHDEYVRIIDDGSPATISEIHQYFAAHGCNMNRRYFRFVKCNEKRAEKTITHYMGQDETLLYSSKPVSAPAPAMELLPQSP